MKINVNRQDISLGLQSESAVCGIAVAMRRMHPDWQRIRVTEDTIKYTDSLTGERFTMPTPDRAAAFVRGFDTDKNIVGPFSFELPAPSHVRPPRPPLQPSKLLEMTIKHAERRRKGWVGTPRPGNSNRRPTGVG